MSVDEFVADFVADHRTPVLTDVMWGITWIGNQDTMRWAALGLVVVALCLGRPFQAGAVWVGMLGAPEIYGSLKDLVGRERPGADLRAGAELQSYAFPSGHAFTAAVFVCLVLMVAWRWLRTDRARRTAIASAGTVAVAVAVSRVYLGYHWTSDVVVGLVLGAGWSGLVVLGARGLAAQWSAASARGWRTAPVPNP